MSLNNIGESVRFSYTGGIQTFTPLFDGVYSLEVFGAKGGNAEYGRSGGYGGRAYGEIELKKGVPIYVVCGGSGSDRTGTYETLVYGGYNGGGNGAAQHCGSGGGATHISFVSGLLKDLSNDKESVIIVGGGGGGAGKTVHDSYSSSGIGGNGGGETGNNGGGTSGNAMCGSGGTQTRGGSTYTSVSGFFGQGGNSGTGNGAGGGGGYYGGGNGGAFMPGGGGSGYVGSLDNSVMENGVNNSNGYAVITFVRKGVTAYLGEVELTGIYLGTNEITYAVGDKN